MSEPAEPAESKSEAATMTISVAEAATLLRKSERQIRYLIKSGELVATRQGKSWRIDASSLPLDDEQRKRLLARADVLVDVATKSAETLAATARAGKRQYSVTDLTAYKNGAPLYRRIAARWGPADPAALRLNRCLVMLAQGCHAYHGAEKRDHYTAARQEASAAVIDLLLHADADADRRDIAEAIEQTMVGPIGGLIRRAERKSRGGRFEHFGAGVGAGRSA